nr:hypothetical protein [Tanacetum cinerariifolium]
MMVVSSKRELRLKVFDLKGNNKPWVNNPESSLTDLLPGLSDTASHESSGQLLSSCQMGMIDQMHMLISSGEFNPSVGASHRREVSLMDEDFFDYTNREPELVELLGDVFDALNCSDMLAAVNTEAHPSNATEVESTWHGKVQNLLPPNLPIAGNQIAKRVIGDLIDLSRETYVRKNLLAQLTLLIAELEAFADPDKVFDTLLCLRDDVHAEEAMFGDLNDCITQAKVQIETKDDHVRVIKAKPMMVRAGLVRVYHPTPMVLGIVYGCYRLEFGKESGGISAMKAYDCYFLDHALLNPVLVSFKQRSAAELEALGDVEGAAKSLEHMRAIVGRDAVTLGELKHCRHGSGGSPQYGKCEAEFIGELESFGVRHVPAKPMEFLKEIQLKDQENMAQMHLLKREKELNASKKELFIKNLNGLVPY